MNLKRLEIAKNYYDNKIIQGKIVVGIENSTIQDHEITLILKPSQIQKILNIIAEEIVSSAKELANELTVTVIEQMPNLLENKESEIL